MQHSVQIIAYYLHSSIICTVHRKHRRSQCLCCANTSESQMTMCDEARKWCIGMRLKQQGGPTWLQMRRCWIFTHPTCSLRSSCMAYAAKLTMPKPLLRRYAAKVCQPSAWHTASWTLSVSSLAQLQGPVHHTFHHQDALHLMSEDSLCI